MQNLWAELNPEPAGHEQVEQLPRHRLTGQAGRGRATAFTASLRHWLQHDYLVPYCRLLSATRIYRRCYWIDGLGSTDLQPIVSLAAELAQESRPLALQGIVLQTASRRGRRSGEGPAYKDMLTLIDQSPAILLLNPFGHTLFTYDDLAPLYQRTAPTELCLFISHKQVMTHLASTPQTSPPQASLPTRGAATDKQVIPARDTPTLTALLRSDRWKALLVNGEAMEQTVHGVIDLLIASMQQYFLAVQRIFLPMQGRPAVVETAPYTLIFATRRQDSLATMNDATCVYRRRLYEQSCRGLLAEEWFAAQQQRRLAEDMQQMQQYTLHQGRAQRVRRWPELRQQLLNSDFGHYTIHEYDAVIQQLLATGDVRCEWRRRPTEAVGNEEQQRIPGNDDTLLWK